MPSLLIQGGRVVSPEDGLDGELDILTDGGVIRDIGSKLNPAGAEILDARGQIVVPGLIDMHQQLSQQIEV